MALFLSYYLLVSVMVMFIFTKPAMSDASTADVIENICRQMEDYGFCRAVFYQNISPPQTTLPDLALLTITQAKNNASNTNGFIQDLLANTSDEAMKTDLIVCWNGYNIVSMLFTQAMEAFREADYSGMLQYEQEAPRAAFSCPTIFETPPTRPSPLIERNKEMSILISMAVVTGQILTDESVFFHVET